MKCYASDYCQKDKSSCSDVCGGYRVLRALYNLSRIPERYRYTIALKPENGEDLEPQEKAYTVEEVAQILGCSERNVYRNIQSGKLEAVEREVMSPTLKKFVTEEALEKYKAGRAS